MNVGFYHCPPLDLVVQESHLDPGCLFGQQVQEDQEGQESLQPDAKLISVTHSNQNIIDLSVPPG